MDHDCTIDVSHLLLSQILFMAFFGMFWHTSLFFFFLGLFLLFNLSQSKPQAFLLLLVFFSFNECDKYSWVLIFKLIIFCLDPLISMYSMWL